MYGQFLFPTPSGRCLVKLALLLVFCCFAECAAGSCIRYGHSCWGGHGKRSHGGTQQNTIKNNLSTLKDNMLLNDIPNDARWFLTRLLQASDNRIFKGRDALQTLQELKAYQERQDVSDDNEDAKIIEDASASEPSDADGSYELPKHPSIPNEKLRLLKYLNNIGKSN